MKVSHDEIGHIAVSRDAHVAHTRLPTPCFKGYSLQSWPASLSLLVPPSVLPQPSPLTALCCTVLVTCAVSYITPCDTALKLPAPTTQRRGGPDDLKNCMNEIDARQLGPIEPCLLACSELASGSLLHCGAMQPEPLDPSPDSALPPRSSQPGTFDPRPCSDLRRVVE